MTACGSCATENLDSSRFCSSCGAALTNLLAVSAAATVAIPAARTASSSSDEGRFPAGTVLAGRYRVLGILGSGGMGEVYRAIDTKLGQPVALKFLPERMSASEQLLARVHGEVRIARQVSHPNVCRVHDIGEHAGMPFLTMEYVDGEDLGSLLRRIGRLPGDKAIEIARRLCAGLAAAHDKGVLHRDLKPANIMIDGRGHVLITDFGLAGLAGQLEGAEIRNGTPAYMAPEQLAGREVSVRSDIYSLGLVFYEMFTGKRLPDSPADRKTPTSLSTHVKDIDPAVERVILRCLAEDAKERPSSALAVAAALPGGDPLLAALAAGETPSPEMVAAAGETASISVRTILGCVAVVVVGIVPLLMFGERGRLFDTPFEYSPAILAQKADDMVRSLGYAERPRDRAFSLLFATAYLTHAEENQIPELVRAQLAAGQPPPIYLWYRESPQSVVLFALRDGDASSSDPPMTTSGMIQVHLDLKGRLINFKAVPPQFEKGGGSPGEYDWSALWHASGIDRSRFAPAEPEWIPPAAFDTRAAWTGTYAHAPHLPMRVEAAAWRGRPVYFEVVGPWTIPARMQQPQPRLSRLIGDWMSAIIGFVLFTAAVLVAWRNFRLGRADTVGSFRLGILMFFCQMASWVLRANHVPTIQEFNGFVVAVSRGLYLGSSMGVLYMALEPYVRRRWPQSLVSWSACLQGRWRDPLVGGHITIGCAAGIVISGLLVVRDIVAKQQGSLFAALADLKVLVSTRLMISSHIDYAMVAFELALILLFGFFLLRVLLRLEWLAAVVFAIIFALPSLASRYWLSEGSLILVFGALLLWTMVRCGVLPLVAAIFVSECLVSAPVRLDFSGWQASANLFGIFFVLAITAFAARAALAGRPIFSGRWLEE